MKHTLLDMIIKILVIILLAAVILDLLGIVEFD